VPSNLGNEHIVAELQAALLLSSELRLARGRRRSPFSSKSTIGTCEPLVSVTWASDSTSIERHGARRRFS